MLIKPPKDRDLPQLRQLWQEAFEDTDAFLDLFFARGFSPERCRCLFHGDQLCAVLYWFDCSWQKKKVAYLYAVATFRQFRGQGLCRMLMEDTHRHLQSLGYAGAALVPGSKDLFSLYEKMGYQAFCPMEKHAVAAATTPVQLTAIPWELYASCREKIIGKGSIVQTGPLLQFLSGYAQFYQCADCVFCVAKEQDQLYFQEFLGNADTLGGIIAALDGKTGHVRLPGGSEPFAMYRSFSHQELPTYLGIPLD